ncbi:thrombospondin-2-like [Ruditapes philippinarum]|uniref:thrombospondin-2-like n=1 Tax=Ruditapes philippinarum TaxID=129788 RepID=UPI00295B9D88|nr:thrombospondin-2-like [Ruditapes philippinarum]
MRCGEYAQIQNTSEVSKMNVEQTSYCQECCSTDKCNNGLCIYPSNTMCKDDKSTDCAKLNSMFSICKVTTQAKKICPRYCNLCNLVDGHWSPWSPWSSCDVTCGIGSEVRHRTCTNPAPQNGGLHCQGRGSQNKFCHLQKCPVHGGWSPWERWGTCSATCGIGIRRRVRSCTNPRPLRFGDHCFGDRHEAELCERISCTRNVAFNAYTTKSNGHYKQGRVLIFPEVSLNDGNGYDPITGIFKAPIAGVYQFSAHICHQAGQSMVVAIMKGTKQITATTGYENKASSCNSVNVISRVMENEKVFVTAQWTHSYLFTNEHRWTSFSGFLMYQL